MAGAITAIGFDADDTLWQNERFFREAEGQFVALLGDFGAAETVSARLFEVERRNVPLYGFGIKGFMLSMIETALSVSGGRVSQAALADMVALGRDMLGHPVEILPDVRQTLERLADRYPLALVTKGDLFDQERKLTASGLAGLFATVDIVSDKSPATYARVFARCGTGPGEALMVGNSLRSDILPALATGAYAAHVPHALTWAYEHVEEPVDHPRFYLAETISRIPGIIEEITGDSPV